MQAQVELAAEHGRDRALLGQPRERVRDEREDVELHQLREPLRHLDPAAGDVDDADAVLDHREQHPGVELEHVVRDTGRHGLHGSERTAGLLHDLQPDELERVVLVLAGGGQIAALDLQDRAALDRAARP